MVELGERYWPKGSTHVAFDPDLLRKHAQLHIDRGAHHQMEVNAGVLAFLLDNYLIKRDA